MKTAKFIKRLREWNGDARFYELSEAIQMKSVTTRFVVVFAAETKERVNLVRIFAADMYATVRNWTVLAELQNETVHERILSTWI